MKGRGRKGEEKRKGPGHKEKRGFALQKIYEQKGQREDGAK